MAVVEDEPQVVLNDPRRFRCPVRFGIQYSQDSQVIGRIHDLAFHS
jgi:hypothetical protein